MGEAAMAFRPTNDRISALQRTLELQDSMKREGVERNEFMGRMEDALANGRAPGAPIDYLYPSGRYDVNNPAGEMKLQETPGTPAVWEPPHYRRPWDAVPAGAIAADPYTCMADPRYHPHYGYGLHTQLQRGAWHNYGGGYAPAPRYPFDYQYGQIFDPAAFHWGTVPFCQMRRMLQIRIRQTMRLIKHR